MLGPHGNSMAITANASVIVAAVLAGCLALKHLAVLRDTVALPLRNAVLAVQGLALRGCPGEVVTADLDVVVRELAELVIIHTKQLSFFRGAQVQTGDFIDDEGEDGADDEGVCGAGDDVGNLLVDSGTLAGNGTSCKTVVDSVETDDVIGAENAVEEKTPHSSDTVLGEHIERIVDLDPELD